MVPRSAGLCLPLCPVHGAAGTGLMMQRARCDPAEAGRSRPRETRADARAVDHGMDREHWGNRLAAAGYLLGLASIVWGLPSGDPLPILLGLVVVAIVIVTTE
jgi:hypothetical protein